MNVFLSYSLGPSDDPIPARLSAVAAAYGMSILVADRTYTSPESLTADTIVKINESDAVLALVSVTARPESWNLVNSEVSHAVQCHKPVIALIENCVPFQTVSGTHFVYFDRFNPVAHESSLITALDDLRRRSKQDFIALAWIAGIAVGLVALSQLSSDDK